VLATFVGQEVVCTLVLTFCLRRRFERLAAASVVGVVLSGFVILTNVWIVTLVESDYMCPLWTPV